MNRSQTLSPVSDASPMPAMARIFLQMLGQLQHGCLELHTPDGQHMRFGQSDSALCADLRLHDWRACQYILSAGDIGLARAWREGLMESADLTALIRLALRNQTSIEQCITGTWWARAWFWLQHQLRPNSRKGSRENIHQHYDLGNDFYRLWLDDSMTYSAAIFGADKAQSLEHAQNAKYQRIIDSLGLSAGQRVLEIGCGWAGFATYAARQGIAVHGITISQAQLDWGQAHIEAQGLSALVELELCDYRDLTGQYDAIVSIEMFEAVGQRYWATYFRAVKALLKPQGKALIQSITIDEQHFKQYQNSSDFIREFIFPGGMLPSVPRFVSAAHAEGLQHLAHHAFGADYAETLRRWKDRFTHASAAVEAQGFDAVFQRTWLMYLCYCEAGFDEGRTDVCHFLLQA